MKKIILISVLCLLAGVSGATFELDDPTQPDENANTGKTISFSGKQPKTTAEHVIVPQGVDLIQPIIENNKCIGFSADQSEIAADGSSGSLTLTSYVGPVISTTNCPVTGSGDKGDLKITLIEINDGRLVWVDSSRILRTK